MYDQVIITSVLGAFPIGTLSGSSRERSHFSHRHTLHRTTGVGCRLRGECYTGYLGLVAQIPLRPVSDAIAVSACQLTIESRRSLSVEMVARSAKVMAPSARTTIGFLGETATTAVVHPGCRVPG